MDNVKICDDFEKILREVHGTTLDQRDKMLVQMAINHAFLCMKDDQKEHFSMSEQKGLYGKYIIQKADGSPVNSFKFVLSPEKDPAAFSALKNYAVLTENDELKYDLYEVIMDIENGRAVKTNES